jgi:hypothetical protein
MAEQQRSVTINFQPSSVDTPKPPSSPSQPKTSWATRAVQRGWLPLTTVTLLLFTLIVMHRAMWPKTIDPDKSPSRSARKAAFWTFPIVCCLLVYGTLRYIDARWFPAALGNHNVKWALVLITVVFLLVGWVWIGSEVLLEGDRADSNDGKRAGYTFSVLSLPMLAMTTVSWRI